MLWINKRLRTILCKHISQDILSNEQHSRVVSLSAHLETPSGEVFLEGCTFSRAGPFDVPGCTPELLPLLRVLLDNLKTWQKWKTFCVWRKNFTCFFIKSLFLISSAFGFHPLLLPIFFMLWCVGLAPLCSCWSQWKTPTAPKQKGIKS